MFALFFRKPFLLLLQQKKAPQGFYINLIFRNAAGELAQMRFRRLQGPVPQPLLISPLFTSCCILSGKWMSVNKKSADSGNSHKLHRTLPQNSGKTRQFFIISFLLSLRFSLPEALPLLPDHLNHRHQSDR